jgi:integrase
MPRLTHSNPRYRKHHSGQAVVTIDSRDFYLGLWKSKASKAEYDRIIGEWLGNGRRLPATTSDLAVAELVERYLDHCRAYYGADEHGPAKAMGPLVKLYGATMVIEFGPLGLEAVREAMIQRGWCRSYVNKQIGEIKRMFRWGVSRELFPAAIAQALDALMELRRGHTAAREREPVTPVADSVVEVTLAHLPAVVAAMVQVQRLSGARPGEVCGMRVGDVDRSGDVWKFTPRTHKTANLGHVREIYFGRRAQAVLSPYMLKLDPNAPVFSPREGEQQRRQEAHENRKTPVSCGNVPGSNKSRRPKRTPGEFYDVAAYRRAIARACDRADSWAKGGMIIANEERAVARWGPHRLRHAAASEIRRHFGLEGAQAALGHRSADVTTRYAERNSELAAKVAAAIG